MRVASFNVQNLRLRVKEGVPRLDPARDDDVAGDHASAAAAAADRHLTAQLLCEADADIVALQEVFDQRTLDYFHDRFLLQTGADPYPVRICLPGNDGRGLSVAVLSRVDPVSVRTHAQETGRTLHLAGVPVGLRDAPVFRRDCLEVQFSAFTLFNCHFKAPYPDAARAFAVRRAEARAVRQIIERRFREPAQARWIIAGDFNEHERGGDPSSQVPALMPLLQGFAIDLAARSAGGAEWTFEAPDMRFRSRPDRILVSPDLARACPDAHLKVLHAEAVGGAHASDHALVFSDLSV